jgi:hypothetical protein
MMAEEFGQRNDVSLFLPHASHLVPHRLFFDSQVSILRFPYFWEDDAETWRPQPCLSVADLELNRSSGLKIFDFHPIHIALNATSMDPYGRCKAALDLKHCRLTDLIPYISKAEAGVGAFFDQLLFEVKGQSRSEGLTIAEAGQLWDL